ncbi:MAG: hypothetical protein KKI09_06525 [Spirochaetes bacterium]|nr:hypothetical protein [Spirochaetota bacterium]
MKKRMCAALTIIALCLSALSCSLLLPQTGELYVSVDGQYNSVTCELYLIKYLEEGADSANGKNIFNKMARTETIDGREWMVFEIPRGEWDIYMEYYTIGAYSSWTNDRNSVNLDMNEWAALWLPTTDWTSTREYSGDGSVDIPI